MELLLYRYLEVLLQFFACGELWTYILSFVWSNTSVVSMLVSGISNISGSRYQLRTICFFLGKYRFYCYNAKPFIYCTAVKRRFKLSELKRSWYPRTPPGVGYGTMPEEFLGSWRWVDPRVTSVIWYPLKFMSMSCFECKYDAVWEIDCSQWFTYRE